MSLDTMDKLREIIAKEKDKHFKSRESVLAFDRIHFHCTQIGPLLENGDFYYFAPL